MVNWALNIESQSIYPLIFQIFILFYYFIASYSTSVHPDTMTASIYMVN